MVVAIIVSIAAIICTSLLCFKGITFHKKMEVIETKPRPTSLPRPVEMDHAETMINEAQKLNRQHQAERQAAAPKPKDSFAAPNQTAMDQVLKNIQDVFGPELPPVPTEPQEEGGN